MAKSARASRTKANRAALKNNIHRPVEEARLQRLSEKLLQITQPGSDPSAVMDVDDDSPKNNTPADPSPESATVSMTPSTAKPAARTIRRKRSAKHSVVFASVKKRYQSKRK